MLNLVFKNTETPNLTEHILKTSGKKCESYNP